MATKGSTILKRDSTTGKFLVNMPRDVRETVGLKEGDPLTQRHQEWVFICRWCRG